MLSRAANSIYWMSRYLERADNISRFIDVNARLILDMSRDRKQAQWEPLVRATGDEADFEARYAQFDEVSVIKFLTFDRRNVNSIISCLHAARMNARSVCEIISTEMWESINTLYHLVEKHSRKRSLDTVQEFLAQVRLTNHLLTGLIENTMSHDTAWHFARLGKLIERADKTARMLDVKYFLLLPNPEYVNSPYDTVEWGAVLKSVTGYEIYRKQYHYANYHDVAQFLIFDLNFSRSIRFCIQGLANSFSSITKQHAQDSAAHKEISKLIHCIKNSDLDTILQSGLHEFIDLIQINLNQFDKALYEVFFNLENQHIAAQELQSCS